MSNPKQTEIKRIYISGPMSGIENLNFPTFNLEAARLRGLGYEVVNPAEINPDPQTTWEQCMRNDLIAMLDCDTLALLPGWANSKGAHLETHIAHRVGIKIVHSSEVV